MREIKFRVWHIRRKEMCPVWGFSDDMSKAVILRERLLRTPRTFSGESPNMFLMQYIGLKDKNGKKIYEGDIVLCQAYGKRWKRWTVDDMVEFRQSLVFEFGGESENPEDLEIIGNKWENKELLND